MIVFVDFVRTRAILITRDRLHARGRCLFLAYSYRVSKRSECQIFFLILALRPETFSFVIRHRVVVGRYNYAVGSRRCSHRLQRRRKQDYCCHYRALDRQRMPFNRRSFSETGARARRGQITTIHCGDIWQSPSVLFLSPPVSLIADETRGFVSIR